MIVNNLAPHMRRHFQQMVDDGPSHLDFPARCARAFDQLKDTHIWHLLAAKLDLQSPADDTEFERKLRDFRECGAKYEPRPQQGLTSEHESLRVIIEIYVWSD